MNLIELSQFIQADMRKHIALEPSQTRQWTVKVKGDTDGEIDAWSNYFARLSPEVDEIVYGEPIVDGIRTIPLGESTVRKAFRFIADIHEIPAPIVWGFVKRDLCSH